MLNLGGIYYVKSWGNFFQYIISLCLHLIGVCQKCVLWLRVGWAGRMEKQETSHGKDLKQKSVLMRSSDV